MHSTLRFGAARGSSSRGGFRALAEMARLKSVKAAMRIHHRRAPRPPLYCKTRPSSPRIENRRVHLLFHISMKHKIQLKSWDEFRIPIPFTKALVLKAPPISVPADASEAHLRDLHQQMQTTLDNLTTRT